MVDGVLVKVTCLKNQRYAYKMPVDLSPSWFAPASGEVTGGQQEHLLKFLSLQTEEW